MHIRFLFYTGACIYLVSFWGYKKYKPCFVCLQDSRINPHSWLSSVFWWSETRCITQQSSQQLAALVTRDNTLPKPSKMFMKGRPIVSHSNAWCSKIARFVSARSAAHSARPLGVFHFPPTSASMRPFEPWCASTVVSNILTRTLNPKPSILNPQTLNPLPLARLQPRAAQLVHAPSTPNPNPEELRAEPEGAGLF